MKTAPYTQIIAQNPAQKTLYCSDQRATKHTPPQHLGLSTALSTSPNKTHTRSANNSHPIQPIHANDSDKITKYESLNHTIHTKAERNDFVERPRFDLARLIPHRSFARYRWNRPNPRPKREKPPLETAFPASLYILSLYAVDLARRLGQYRSASNPSITAK